MNEKNRMHKNSPKEYGSFARNLVEIDLMSITERSAAQQGALQERINKIKGVKDTFKDNKEEKNNNAQQSATTSKTERHEAQQEIIDVLKTQLDKANDEKGVLMRLLDQQQLSLSGRNKIKILEIELEETSETQEDVNSEKYGEHKSKWYEFWK